MDGSEYKDCWLCTFCNKQESSRRLTKLETFQTCYWLCSQGSSRTTFSSFIAILHQSKRYLNSVIVNPSLQKLFSFFLMNRMQLKCNKFPTLLCFLVYLPQKKLKLGSSEVLGGDLSIRNWHQLTQVKWTNSK